LNENNAVSAAKLPTTGACAVGTLQRLTAGNGKVIDTLLNS